MTRERVQTQGMNSDQSQVVVKEEVEKLKTQSEVGTNVQQGKEIQVEAKEDETLVKQHMEGMMVEGHKLQ